MTEALTAPKVTDDQIGLIRSTVAKGATDPELELFFYDCARRNVHPLDKLIHFTKRDGKYTPITSIDFMRSRAADSGEYAGNDDAIFVDGETHPIEAKVTVYRMVAGTRCPFSATARWSEYYPGDKQGFMWRKMPHTMLGKCAEALALRKGFPQQLAGLYAREEMDQAGTEPVPIVEAQTVSRDDGATVNEVTGEVLEAPPAGTVRLESFAENPTKSGKMRYLVTDHAGQTYTLWPRFKDDDGEWVSGERVGTLVQEVIQTQEPVLIEVRESKFGKDLIGVSRQSDEPSLLNNNLDASDISF